MKTRHYVAIAIRLFALFLAIGSVPQFQALAEALANGGEVNGFAVWLPFQLFAALLPLLVAAGLWRFPTSVANFIVKPETDKDIEPVSVPSMLRVFLIALGLYVLSYAIPDIFYWATYINMLQHEAYSPGPFFDLGKEGTSNMVATLAELTIGIVLVLKARSLSAKLLKVTS